MIHITPKYASALPISGLLTIPLKLAQLSTLGFSITKKPVWFVFLSWRTWFKCVFLTNMIRILANFLQTNFWWWPNFWVDTLKSAKQLFKYAWDFSTNCQRLIKKYLFWLPNKLKNDLSLYGAPKWAYHRVDLAFVGSTYDMQWKWFGQHLI